MTIATGWPGRRVPHVVLGRSADLAMDVAINLIEVGGAGVGSPRAASHGPAIDISTEARLPLESEERSRVEYMLQMSMQSSPRRARISDIVAVSNPHLNLRFQKRTRGLDVVECWVDASMLDGQNTLGGVINKGFVVGQKGLVFTYGAVDVPRGTEGNTHHQLILCHVGVGVSMCMEASAIQGRIDLGEEVVVPDGYDSIFIHNGPINPDLADDNEADRARKTTVSSVAGMTQQRFLVRDPDLVLPVYVLTCEVKAFDQRNKAEVCNSCETAPAVVFCHADNASLCERCDRAVHSTNKVVSKHRRVPISEKPVTDFGTCVYHPDNTIAYYCHLCQVPVCIHCKMIGSHSAGDASTHKLTAIREAYDLALMASRKSDPFLAERRMHIMRDLDGLDKKLMSLNLNTKEVEAEILRKMEQALADLKKCAQAKVSVVLAEEVDLKRQLFRISWLEEFLTLQQRSLGPVEFLEAWSRHVKYRTELHTPPSHSGVRRSRTVRPDIIVQGALTVSSMKKDDSMMGSIVATEEDDRENAAFAQQAETYDDDEVLRSEKSLRSELLRDLDQPRAVEPARAPSPANSVSSVYSVAQSLAHSVSSGVAAPGGRSLKELIAVYEAGHQQQAQHPYSSQVEGHRSSVERRSSHAYRSPDQIIAERMRTPSRTQVHRRDASPAPSNASSSMSKVSASKGWADAWHVKLGSGQRP
ncbi:unnamed protein product (mitochondrion) [Plasmodiophora brassicae]|uniref:B box-type domain-containing protein n=1 Tax=Plasmodiophora brassicae TaxID=37360 RepID=A0A3P3YM50_PLABS|nr:unnamed protein product [Plasmodiophora brassicae]